MPITCLLNFSQQWASYYIAGSTTYSVDVMNGVPQLLRSSEGLTPVGGDVGRYSDLQYNNIVGRRGESSVFGFENCTMKAGNYVRTY